MTDAVYIEKITNHKYCLTTYAESLAEAQCLLNLILNAKPPVAFQPVPPLNPEVEALLDRADELEAE